MFEEIALAERRVADVRLAELGAMHRRAMEQFDSQASLRVLRARLFATRLAARQADEFSAMYRERGPDDDAALMVEEVMLSLEEVAFQLEELLPGVPEGSPLAGIDPAEFFAAAEALTEEPFPEPLYDPALTERLREAIAERLEGIDD